MVGAVPPREFGKLFKPWKWGQTVLDKIKAEYVDSETIVSKMYHMQ